MKHKSLYLVTVIVLLLLPCGLVMGYENNGIYTKATLILNNPELNVIQDGNATNHKLDCAPYNPDGTTLIPVRGVLDACGDTVTWSPAQRQVEVSNSNSRIIMTLNSDMATVNNAVVKMSRPAQVVNGRTMIPLRFVSENMGYEVKWYANEQKIEIIKQIAARVNGKAISLSDVNKTQAIYKYVLEKNYGPAVWEQKDEKGNRVFANLQDMILNELIIGEVTQQKAVNDKVTVSVGEIEQALKAYLANAQQDPGLVAVLTKNSISDSYLRQMISRDILVNKYNVNYLNSVKISDNEIKAYFQANQSVFNEEQVKAAHILIKTLDTSKPENNNANQASLQKAQDILKRAQGGEEFAALAKEYSQDPGSAFQGGDLGYFSRGQMVKPFEDAAFSLRPGQISGIVQSIYGYHIIKVLDHKTEIASLNDLNRQIIQGTLIKEKARIHADELVKAAQVQKY